MGHHDTYSRGFWLTDDDEELNRSKEYETEMEKGISTTGLGEGGLLISFFTPTW